MHLTKTKRTFLLTIFFLLTMMFSMTASAKWVKNSDGSRSFKKNGQIYTDGMYKIKSDWYAFNENGQMQIGMVEFDGKTYYFNPANGKRVKKKTVTVNGDKYYFTKDGSMLVNGWSKKRYFGEDGKMLKNAWAEDKYVGAKGTYVTGLKKIDGVYYYFNKKTGSKLVNKSKKVKKVLYIFDENGEGTISDGTKTAGTTEAGNDEDDLTLLASIIYCEAGNQPYAGQLAVGLVITNRVRAAGFPNTIKGVVYAVNQFAPTRDGSLARALANYKTLVTPSCKKAAQEVLDMYSKNQYKITLPNGKKKSMKGYYFFMTSAAYKMLRLRSATRTIGAHVFFKTWMVG